MSAQQATMADKAKNILHKNILPWLSDQLPRWHSRGSFRKDWRDIMVVAFFVSLLIQLQTQSLLSLLYTLVDFNGDLNMPTIDDVIRIGTVVGQTAPLCLSVGLIFLLYIWDILKGKKNDIAWIGLIMYTGLSLCTQIGAWPSVPRFKWLLPPGVGGGGPLAGLFATLELIYNPLATYYRGFGPWGFGYAVIVGLFLAWAVGKKLAPRARPVQPQPAVAAAVAAQQPPYDKAALSDDASGKTTPLAVFLMIATTVVATACASVLSLSLPKPGIDTWSGGLPLVLVACCGGLIAAATTLVGRVALNRSAEIPAFVSFVGALVYVVVTGQVQSGWDRSLMLLTGQLSSRMEFFALAATLFSIVLCVTGTFTVVYAITSNTHFCEICQRFMKSMPRIQVLPARQTRVLHLVKSRSFGTLIRYCEHAIPQRAGSQPATEVEIFYCESCHIGNIAVYIPENVNGNTVNRQVVSEPLQPSEVEAILQVKEESLSSGGGIRKRLLLLPSLCLILLLLLLQGCGDRPSPPQWPEFTSKEGRFSVLMPDKPTEHIDDESGIAYHRFMVDQQDSSYSISYADLPPIIASMDPDEFMNTANLLVIQALDGKLLEAKSISLQGFPGKEMKVEVPSGPGYAWVRVYLVKSKQYNLLFLTEQDHTTLPPEAEYFFTSLKITPP
jgi:hypothetical protein